MYAAHQHLGDELLNSWLDGVATDAERRLVENHIATCETCQHALDSLAVVKQSLSELPEPALPRSFQLTPEQAKKPTQIRSGSGSSPSNIVQMMPVVRMMSIAAVIAFLVFGAASAFGPVRDIVPTDEQTSFSAQGTDEPDEALEDADAAIPPPMSALPTDLAEGEVVDQGDSATSGDTASRALNDMALQRETVASEADDGWSFISVAAVTAGILAIATTALWLGLNRVQQHSTKT